MRGLRYTRWLEHMEVGDAGRVELAEGRYHFSSVEQRPNHRGRTLPYTNPQFNKQNAGETRWQPACRLTSTR